jgi:hypothetical protein
MPPTIAAVAPSQLKLIKAVLRTATKKAPDNTGAFTNVEEIYLGVSSRLKSGS